MSQIEVELQETMGSDEAIANAAWTSTYNKAKREGKYDEPDKVAGIVRRCVNEGHSVPLESVVFRFWIRLPIFSDRQHVTHRIASHNGLSGRYRTVPDDFYGVPEDVRDILARVPRLRDEADRYRSICANAHMLYSNWLLELRGAEIAGMINNAEYKRARELLRAVIPTAFMVERTTIMNLVSFANYQRLRNNSHAQPEICRVAELMLHAVIASGVAPVAIEALMAKGWLVAEPNHEWAAVK